MGIIIGDTINLTNGLSASNTYGSFGDSILTVEKIEETTLDENQNENTTYSYRISCKGSIWTSIEYRNQKKPKIHLESIDISVETSQLNSNLYGILYTNWKNKYTSVSDSTD